MIKTNSYNYSDMSPKNLRDFNLINSLDQEQFLLYGVAISYYKNKPIQQNYDSTYRDMLSSKEFEDPIQIRSFFKVDESTTHGMSEIGVDQLAERNGEIWFNILMLENQLQRKPEIGDCVEDLQIHQLFEIFQISKEVHKLGRPIRYKCSVRLYQGTK